VLRSWSYGEHNYAIVEGDKIMHDGVSVTPNQFARSFARTARNAWFDLSVRRPGEKRFTIASRLRRELAEEVKTGERSRHASAENPPAFAVSPGPIPVPGTPAPATMAATPVVQPTPDVVAAVVPAPQLEPAPHGQRPDFDPGWNLPERRRFRYRAEDIAY
jgi:hypothetical protein